MSSLAQTFFVDGNNPICPGTGTPADPFCTIQAAIDAATTGDTIEVAPGTYLENVNLSGKSLTLVSEGGADETIIDGGAAGSVVTAALSEVVGIDGFTIRNGSAASRGGGIYCFSGTLTLTNSTVTGNSSSSYGGGVYIRYGVLTIDRCTLTGNTSINTGGGAVRAGGSTATISNSTFSGNMAWVGNGGGINAGSGGTVTVTNTTFSGNSSANSGGGLFCLATPGTVLNSTFSGNTSTIGGAITSVASPTNVANSILWGNSSEISGLAGGSASYSDIQGGYAGASNINLDPKLILREPNALLRHAVARAF